MDTALLVMDTQAGILSRFDNAAEYINLVARAISLAREKKLQVIYENVGFRPGAPEASINNKAFAGSKERFASMDMADFMKIPSQLAPAANDICIVTRRVSAFTGSDLEVVLRSCGIEHIVLTGMATSGGVLSTLREAADKDYRITVIADCCADTDDEVHRVLTLKVFPRQADVINLADWD